MNHYLGIVTTIIAIIGAFIAYQQHKVNKHKLRLDLYERRLNVYRSVMVFLTTVLQNAEVTPDNITNYFISTSEACFLFDKEVKVAIDKIYDNALKFRKTEDSELLLWFTDQYTNVNQVFSKYLSFKDIKD
ncbi:hypothetical protein [Paenibacillus turpanensis]|uniref:hypothetical protein n=1 Tax=Paenibacillus turpanensis TaxID=2689078 RepID=UPI00140E924D|nr:hypothetical protein [Paenibacillus turpanensis]